MFTVLETVTLKRGFKEHIAFGAKVSGGFRFRNLTSVGIFVYCFHFR